MTVSRHAGHHPGLPLTMSWHIELPVKSRVVAAPGVRKTLPTVMGQLGLGRRVVLFHQPAMTDRWLGEVSHILDNGGYQVFPFLVPDGEECKSTQWLLRAWDELQRLQLSRSDTLIGLGGGAVCDLTGFAASTYLRGVNLVLLPTTLLAQVDAAVGGKTAVNLDGGKNLAGTLYFPKAVLVDSELLSTLPGRQIRSGMGEIVKYALIEKSVEQATDYRMGPRSLLELLEENLDDGFGWDNELLPGITTTCVKLKLYVVGHDAQEFGLRRLLNLGHTLGHALEKASSYEIAHGEAVSVGVMLACRLSVNLGRMSHDDLFRLQALFARAGLPTDLPSNLSITEIMSAIGHDKKRFGESLRFVLPLSPLGLVDFDVDISPEALSELL